MLAMSKAGKDMNDICKAVKGGNKDIEARIKELQGGVGDDNDDTSDNDRKVFSKKQDKTILGMKKNGKTWAEIATAVNATKDEVRWRFKDLDSAGNGNKNDSGGDGGFLGGFDDGMFGNDESINNPGGGGDPTWNGGDPNIWGDGGNNNSAPWANPLVAQSTQNNGKKKDKNGGGEGKKNKNGKQKVQNNIPDGSCSDDCQDCLNCPDCLKFKEKPNGESNDDQNQNQNQNNQYDWNGTNFQDDGYNWKSNNDNTQSNWDYNTGQDPFADPAFNEPSFQNQNSGYQPQNQTSFQDHKGYQAQDPFSNSYQPQHQNQNSFQDQKHSFQSQAQNPPPRSFQDQNNNGYKHQDPFNDFLNNQQSQPQNHPFQDPPNRQRHLRPNAVWTQEDCSLLEDMERRYVENKWHHIQAGFFNQTGRMVEWYIIEGKFREDGLA
jgi:hypothetical protein